MLTSAPTALAAQPIEGNIYGGNYRGFLLDSKGTYSEFDASTAGPCCTWTFSVAINPAGTVVGFDNDGYNVYHGFLRDPNGTITLLDVPGAGTGFDQGTIALGINPAGTVMGISKDANNASHGFLWTPKQQ